jgi:hypothetical protein
MKTFTIHNDNNISVFASKKEAAAASATPFDPFTNASELAEFAAAWPASRLIEIWNSIPGVSPVAKFTSRKTATERIWKAIQNIEPTPDEHMPAQLADVAPATAPAAPRPSRRMKATAEPNAAARDGSKTAQVVAMLQREGGATLVEIMEQMGWQRHTVRGFMAGAMKKAGYTVESFKPEGGERTYRISK